MAITSQSFHGQPDKHIRPSATSGPQTDGNYSNTTPGSVGSSDADATAQNVYGTPGDGTRMGRRAGLVEAALEATPNGIEGAQNTGPAFIDGDTAQGFTSTMGSEDNMGGFTNGSYPQAADVPGTPGFPGGDQWQVDNDKLPRTPPIQATKAVVAKSNVSNHPAVPGSPGFPGLP